MDYADLRRRTEWLLEHKAKPGLLADGHHDPVVFVFGDRGFLNAVNLSLEGDRPVREEVDEAVEFSGGTAFVFIREVAHPRHGEALLVRLEHPLARALWCTPFLRRDGIVLRPTQIFEGEGAGRDWEAALWRP